MRQVRSSSLFEKDLKRAHRRGAAGLDSLEEAISYLERGEPLPEYFSDHTLARDFTGLRECHLDGDLLLIYRAPPTTLTLYRIGTHAELFTVPLPRKKTGRRK